MGAMKCEICKKSDANVFIKQVVDGVVRKLHACQDCARAQGFDVKLPMPLLKDLLFGGAAEAPAKPAAPARTCPACQMTAAEFRKTSLLGCPACYDVFADEVAPYLDSLPENPGHCGKVPARERAAAELAALQRSLKDAVDTQRFEEAAQLRDRLRALHSAARRGHDAEDGARRKPAPGEGRR
jgi:protein arginine kinase activator